MQQGFIGAELFIFRGIAGNSPDRLGEIAYTCDFPVPDCNGITARVALHVYDIATGIFRYKRTFIASWGYLLEGNFFGSSTKAAIDYRGFNFQTVKILAISSQGICRNHYPIAYHASRNL